MEKLLDAIISQLSGSPVALVLLLACMLEGYVILALWRLVQRHQERAEERLKRLEEINDRLRGLS